MVACGDYGRAMHSLCKVDVVSAQSSLVGDIRSSLPERSYNVISREDRDTAFSKFQIQSPCDDDNEDLVTPEKVTIVINKLKKNRAPGLDGLTVEHLYSLLFGGRGDINIKKPLLSLSRLLCDI